MGNFSINHYARFNGDTKRLSLRYILDFAEISTAERMAELDRNGNNKVEAAEKTRYLNAQAQQWRAGLTLTIDGQKVPFSLRPAGLDLPPGAGGLPTMRALFQSDIAWPQDGNKKSHRVFYRDANFAGRTGWKEIIVGAQSGGKLQNSDAAAKDVSRELTIFPTDGGRVAPSQTEANFTIAISNSASNGIAGASQKPLQSPGKYFGAASTATAEDHTPQNRFTQAIAAGKLTPGAMMLGILIALGFGAIHALSPGHGKTMVAAYLVGTRGTPRHAALLGLVVTVTHTFGVFVLGFITLFAANYIVPEKLYPVLSAVSGMLILGVGLWLLLNRVQDLGHQSHDPSHAHDHSHDGHSHDHSHDDHSHDDHSHDDHSHSHEAGLVHSHGGRAHSHAIPEGPVTARTLVALGISGGIVPCPEAIVVLLAAIKMGRIAYGLVLISAFSIGLAAALIAIGLTVVAARRHLSRWENLPAAGAITRFLPIGSAAVITVIGAILTIQASLGKS